MQCESVRGSEELMTSPSLIAHAEARFIEWVTCSSGVVKSVACTLTFILLFQKSSPNSYSFVSGQFVAREKLKDLAPHLA